MSQPPEPPPLKRPDPLCQHMEFSADVQCIRIKAQGAPLNAKPYTFIAELRVSCVQCGGDFMFSELPWGINIDKPGVNVSKTKASLPMKPWDGELSTGACQVEMPK